MNISLQNSKTNNYGKHHSAREAIKNATLRLEDSRHRLADNPFLRLSASLYSINNVILELVDKQYFVFLRHLILGDAMTKLGKKVLPRYYNNIATLL